MPSYCVAKCADSIAALSHLAERDEAQAQAAVDAFYERWQADTLVLDKWFAVQAMADRDDVLERIAELMQHPAFSITDRPTGTGIGLARTIGVLDVEE